MMKNCPNCNADIEEGFKLCWNCNYSFVQNEIIDINDISETERNINCLRCDIKLVYSGNYKFHEGAKFGVFGNLLEVFVNRESFDIYICPKCGKTEFYIPR